MVSEVNERYRLVAIDWAKAAGVGCSKTSITIGAAPIDLRCCSWWYQVEGQGTHIAPGLWGSTLHEFRILGADGLQEHLRPAVLETDAVRSAVFMRAFEAA